MQDMAKTQLIIRGGAFGFAVQVKAGANNKLGIKSSTMILLSLFFWMLIHKVQGKKKKKTPTKYNLLLKQKLTMHLAGLPLKLELCVCVCVYIYAILSDQ
jgi:hypothetical protein